ncbi:flagellar basal body-associated FliL family protein, partial [bacterium]|nr:flagellar basal body-associated FliL family protein [bacterium]
AIIAEMEQYKPAIRDAVIYVLSGKTADELSSVTGKEIAKEEIQDLVSAIFNGGREVLRVNFAQFIIQ